MTCCGKTKSVLKKSKHIAIGYTNLVRGKKFEYTDRRIRVCQKCDWSYWIHRNLFCKLWLRRFGRTIWPDPKAFVPARARVENEKCPKNNWLK